MKAEEVVEGGLLIVLEDAVDAVLQGETEIENAAGIDRGYEHGVAKASVDEAGIGRQEAAEAVEPFGLVVGTGAGAEAEREPLAGVEGGGEIRGEHGAK